VFGGSFNPPGMNHDIIAKKLSEMFDLVLIAPCGIRTDKPSTAVASPAQRKTMATLAFNGMPKMECDFYDLDNDVFTPTYLLQERYQKHFPNAEIWFVIGDDLLKEIRPSWKEGEKVWHNLMFAVVCRHGKKPDPSQLPPLCQIIEMDVAGRSSGLREKISRSEPIDHLVTPEVAKYIKDQGLYETN